MGLAAPGPVCGGVLGGGPAGRGQDQRRTDTLQGKLRTIMIISVLNHYVMARADDSPATLVVNKKGIRYLMFARW